MDGLWASKSEGVGLIPTYVVLIHQRYRQTDGRTDRRTTCSLNTALCTVVHRAVKSSPDNDNVDDDDDNGETCAVKSPVTCVRTRITEHI